MPKRPCWNDLQDEMAALRDKAKNNALEGSQDERDAWAGMSAEVSRLMRLHVRIKALTDIKP